MVSDKERILDYEAQLRGLTDAQLEEQLRQRQPGKEMRVLCEAEVERRRKLKNDNRLRWSEVRSWASFGVSLLAFALAAWVAFKK